MKGITRNILCVIAVCLAGCTPQPNSTHSDLALKEKEEATLDVYRGCSLHWRDKFKSSSEAPETIAEAVAAKCQPAKREYQEAFKEALLSEIGNSHKSRMMALDATEQIGMKMENQLKKSVISYFVELRLKK